MGQTMRRKVAAYFPLRLVRLVLPFVTIIIAQALLANLSLQTLSAVRAYVGGEGLWSKGQKDAIYFLKLYSITGDERYFHEFQQAIAIPLADLRARKALEAPNLDFELVRAEFLRGRIDPDDIDGIVWLFRYFHGLSYMANAIHFWTAADPLLEQLNTLGASIHETLSNPGIGAQGVDQWGADIEELGRQLGTLALAFSESLGAGSRSITSLLTVANLLAALALVIIEVWHIRNIWTQREASLKALSAEKERAQITLSSLGESVISTDVDGRLDYLNPEAERLLGVTAAGAKGLKISSLFDVIDESTRERSANVIDAARYDGTKADHLLLVRRDASEVPVSIAMAPLRSNGAVTGAVMVLHDITKERTLISRLSWQASHDSLSGLANRREFETRVADALRGCANTPGQHSLMFLDLDQFKVVNDTCGHAAGDELLRQTSKSLQGCLRDRDLLARLGGDEFGVLLQECAADCAIEVAERLRLAVQELKFVWNGRAFRISASIGLVHITQGDTVDEIMQAADVACYMAKEKGRNRVQQHSRSDAELTKRVGEMAWVHRIRNALDDDRFCLYAQEIRALSDDERGQLHAELLLRLRDEDGTLVQPGGFMPAAERFGLMPEIDRWVVRNAFRMLAERQKSPRAATLNCCAINVSGASLGDEEFVNYVRQQFAEFQIPPQMICFEITETSAIANLSCAKNFILALRRFGCGFSLDDFGTGMSSFAYLKNLPVDFLKIDGTFVREMLRSKVDRAMIEMIAHVAKTLGKRVIAEFVESDEIVAALRDIGVHYAQGYAIGRPEPFEGYRSLSDGALRPLSAAQERGARRGADRQRA